MQVTVRDAETNQPLPARVDLSNAAGEHFFFSSRSEDGSAIRYEKQNWNNDKSIEYHTTLSAHPAATSVPPGKYLLVVERGKTYHPWTREIQVQDSDVDVEVSLQRWANPVARGWYSGDTHIHREIDELRNVILAEDLNVVFPLTNWVTIADTPPSAGNKNVGGSIPNKLIEVDSTHVIWPLNTEYEIFRVGDQRHTLGALFALGHHTPLETTVPTWKPVVDAARKQDPNVLFDLDKLAWPFSMVLPTVAPDATYELANNHFWRTEFAFRDWESMAPPYIQPPFGGKSGNERQWIDLTLGMYYTLLNCGFRLPPSAGTANGVHPVPAGFGRVYVHLPDGLDYQNWRKGLQRGRSFVTTGPMLYATAAGKDPGQIFLWNSEAKPFGVLLQMEVISEQPLTFGEVLINGQPEHLLRPQNQKTDDGAYRSVIDITIYPKRSGWFAVRFWEDRPNSKTRFVHSAPWYVEIDNEPVKLRAEERRYLVGRMKDEIQRSRGIVSAEGIAEYEQALKYYQSLPAVDERDSIAAQSRPLTAIADRDRWLDNMITYHRFSAEEVQRATGMSLEQATAEREARHGQSRDASQLHVLAYPGGRHPRRGFLDGAIDPQRETKISVFPPWQDGGYAVVDLPEAIFSNLGLTYLAHTHIPTIWSAQGIELDRLEWQTIDGGLEFRRQLPNGITMRSRAEKRDGGVAMHMWLTNGTDEELTGLRTQVCVMLKGLSGFQTQHKRTKIERGPLIAAKADDNDRWIITVWDHGKRTWSNPPVPCIHSDPVFPDCPPGETMHLKGGLWFYQGSEIEVEIDRIMKLLGLNP